MGGVLAAAASAKPAKLLRKSCLVSAIRGDDPQRWERLAVYTLTFANPGDGERLPCRIECGDVVKVMIPHYKPKSYSMSRQGEGEFDITYKAYPGGRCSGYLDSLALGDEVTCFARGAKRRNGGGSHVGLVAFGVGITEALPLAAAELGRGEARRVKLIWANKTWGDAFWTDDIEALKEEHGERFEVVHVLSREEKEGFRGGRVDPAMLKAEFDEAWGVGAAVDRADVRLLSVGTKAMMRDFDSMIYGALGYKDPKNRLLVK